MGPRQNFMILHSPFILDMAGNWNGQNNYNFSTEVNQDDFTSFDTGFTGFEDQPYAPINNQQHQNWNTKQTVKKWAQNNVQKTPNKPQWAQNFNKNNNHTSQNNNSHNFQN